MKALPLMVQKIWQRLGQKFFFFFRNVGQSLKGHGQGHKVIWHWCHLKWFHELSIHAKYEVSISYESKFMAKIKNFFLPQSERVTDSRKLDASEFHSGA